MRRYLQMDDIPEDWPRIVAETPRSAVGPDKSFRFLEIIDEVERRFIAQYPEARRNREVRAFKAQLQTHALFQLALISRLAGAKVMSRIVRGDPSIALKVLPKFAAYFVFKRRANREWEWLRSRVSRWRQHRSLVK